MDKVYIARFTDEYGEERGICEVFNNEQDAKKYCDFKNDHPGDDWDQYRYFYTEKDLLTQLPVDIGPVAGVTINGQNVDVTKY